MTQLKRVFALILFVTAGFAASKAQFQGCPAITAPNDTAICGGCVTLVANPVGGFETTDYTVAPIPYSPFPYNGGVPILVGQDDIFSDVIPLPFPFCFYGTTYNDVVIGSNGIISFDLTNANLGNTWPIGAAVPSPFPTDLVNSIMGPWHDIDPNVGGTLNWSVYGTAPCRVLVVNWNQIPMFSCNNLINTQQTCLYETTNIIETYIADKPICASWNAGTAIHAIQNATGTSAVVVPGRNFPTQWAVTNDAQRWTPSGAPTYTISWWEGPNQISNNGTVVVCPTGITTYTAQAVYHNCNGDSVVVTEDVTVTPGAMTLSVSHTDVNCFGQNTGTATATATGTGVLTYQWSNFQNTATITNLAAGAYFVTVTDPSIPCSLYDTVIVTQPPQLTAVISGSGNVACNGGNDGWAEVTSGGGTGPHTYLWTPSGQTSDSAVGLTAQAYTVTVTDSLGCTATANVTINQPGTLIANLVVNQITCFGANNGSATASGFSGSGPYTYAWSHGPVTPAVNNLSPGSYTVTVTDNNGCQATNSFTLIQPTQVTLVTGSTPETCAGLNNGSASVNATGGTGVYSYQWSGPPPNQLPTLSNIPGGNYTVTVTDGNGCQAIANVTVGQNPSPSADAGPNASFCAGTGGAQLFGSAVSGTAPYYYSWTCANPPCALDSVFDNDPIANPNATQMYYLTVTDFNGCVSAPDSVLVTVLPLPIADAGPDRSICQQPAPGAFLTPSVSGAPGPYTFQWVPALGLNDPTLMSPFARPDTTMIYYLIVTSGNGCVSESNVTDPLSSVVVTVEPLPLAHAGDDREVCFNDTIMLNAYGTGAGPAYGFEWSPATGLSNPNIANPIASPPATTDYVLTVWSNNCPSIGDTVTITVLTQPTVDAGPNRDVCMGGSVLLDAQAGGVPGVNGFTYQWSPANDLSSATVEDPIASPPFTTWYYVWAESVQGCRSAQDSVLVTIRETPLANAGPDLTWCKDTTGVTLSGSFNWWANNPPANPNGAFYFWEPAQYISGANDVLNPVAMPPSTMYFYFTVNFDSCFTTDSVLVTVFEAIVADVQADTTTICSGDSLLLTASGGNGGATFNWFPNVGLTQVSGTTVYANPTDTTTYFVVAQEGSCTDTTEITLNVIPTPNAAFLSSFTEGCEDLPVSFLSTASDALLQTWYFGDGSISNETNPLHVYTNPGTYFVTLLSQTTGGCKSTSPPVEITVHPEFSVNFTSDPAYPADLPLPGAIVNFRPDSPLAIDYLWNFGDGTQSTETQPTHEYMEVGVYEVTLRARNEIGCTSEVTHGPYVVHESDLMIPNVFSPNGDNINDEFFVRYTGNQPLSLQVIDRWGNMIYESRDKYVGWDGLYKNEPAPAGVYYYTVLVGGKPYTGSVTLVR